MVFFSVRMTRARPFEDELPPQSEQIPKALVYGVVQPQFRGQVPQFVTARGSSQARLVYF